jgi:hypothetical protein
MSFSTDQGYIPNTIETLMSSVRENVNTQFGTSYTASNFVGTNFYKYFYALIQRLQENEVKTSEIVLKLQQYFEVTNEEIQRPLTTHPGIVALLAEEGYVASTKPPETADAGKVFVCVDVEDNHAVGEVEITSYANLVSGTDDSVTVGATVFTAQSGSVTLGQTTFQAATSNEATATSLAAQINAHATAGALVEATADGAVVTLRAISGGTAGNSIALAYTDNDTNVGATVSGAFLAGGADVEVDYDVLELQIAELLSTAIAAGIVSQGTEGGAVVMDNNQSFDFLYNLPTRQRTYLRLTISISDNNEFDIPTDAVIKAALLANVQAKYRLGRNFEPQTYFSIVDAPWAASILLEYSDDNSSWVSTVADLDYDDLYEFALADITLVQS